MQHRAYRRITLSSEHYFVMLLLKNDLTHASINYKALRALGRYGHTFVSSVVIAHVG